MTEQKPTPVEYLVVGHIAKDLTPKGPLLGGSVAYAGRTARAFGLRVGMLTSVANDIDLNPLQGIQILSIPTKQSTTFENRYTPKGRDQILHAVASSLEQETVPTLWHQTPIVHLAPIANEIEPHITTLFSNTFLGLTPQGWLRRWDKTGKIYPAVWSRLIPILPIANAVVIGVEDLSGDIEAAREMAHHCEILAMTLGAQGVDVVWRGQERRVPAPPTVEIDPTGAGDIFATVFFIELHQTKDPWQAAYIANVLAAHSVTRKGIEGTPTPQEVRNARAQVMP